MFINNFILEKICEEKEKKVEHRIWMWDLQFITLYAQSSYILRLWMRKIVNN